MTTLPFRRPTPPTFHVLFIPGTVQDLRIFSPSLAVWGNGCQIRLVSNGCSAAEDQMLHQLTKLSSRFEFYRLPTRRMWQHGRALSHLQKREASARFAFLDSDIFATGDFLRDLDAMSGTTDALFSCPAVWSTEQTATVPLGFQLASGPNFQMNDGFCMGGSYFAIYDNRALNDCLQTYGIDLRAYLWEDISATIRQRLTAAGRQMAYYDTTKLANILLNLDGYDCQFRTTPHLHHVGGVSATAPPTDLPGWVRRRISQSLPRFVRQMIAKTGLRRNWREQVSADEHRCRSEEAGRRRSVCAHIYELLRRLNRGESPGITFRSGDMTLDLPVRRMEEILCDQFPRWHAWLDGRELLVADEHQQHTRKFAA